MLVIDSDSCSDSESVRDIVLAIDSDSNSDSESDWNSVNDSDGG